MKLIILPSLAVISSKKKQTKNHLAICNLKKMQIKKTRYPLKP